MKMKKVLSIVLAAIMAVTLLAACGGTKSATKMTMGTGGTAGTYYAFGGVLGQYIQNKAGIEVNVVSIDGSKANIESIDSGDYQLGTVQSDVMAYAWAGSRSFESNGAINSFRVVGGLYAEAVQLITMDPNVKSVADLAGKSVSIGAPGSGTYFNAMDVLGAAGLTEADIKTEAERILSGFRSTEEPNSPSGTHFQVKLSDDFAARANSRQMTKLSKYLPFKSFALSSVKDQKGRYATISADEDRSKPLRDVKPRKKEQAL